MISTAQIERRCKRILISHGYRLHKITGDDGSPLFYITAYGLPRSERGPETVYYTFSALQDYCDRLDGLKRQR